MSSHFAPGRKDLDFPSLAREAFTFVKARGFTEFQSEINFVRYKKGELVLEVHHGRLSYEVSVTVSRSGVAYYLGSFVRLAEGAGRYIDPTAVSKAALEAVLPVVASTLQRYGSRALDGDAQFFELLDRQTKQMILDRAAESQISSLRFRAKRAFDAERYCEAAELYARIKGELAPGEMADLSLARRRCSDPKSGA